GRQERASNSAESSTAPRLEVRPTPRARIESSSGWRGKSMKRSHALLVVFVSIALAIGTAGFAFRSPNANPTATPPGSSVVSYNQGIASKYHPPLSSMGMAAVNRVFGQLPQTERVAGPTPQPALGSFLNGPVVPFPDFLVSYGDPALAAGVTGNFYYASLSISSNSSANRIELSVSNAGLFDPAVDCNTPLATPEVNACWTPTFITG